MATKPGVPLVAWDLFIGYQSAQKWLKESELSFDDYYQKVIVPLTETGRLIIDKIDVG